MRIRSVALAYMTGMGLLAVAGAATVAYQEWDRLAAVHHSEALINSIGAANRFVEALALERGVYNQVLVSADAAFDAKEQLVVDRLRMTNAVFDDTFAALGTMDPTAARPLRELVGDALGILLSARFRADQTWQPADSGQGSAEARVLVAEYVKAAAVLDRAVVLMERALGEHNPRLGLMIGVSRLSNEMREIAGLRSTLLSHYAGTRQTQDAAAAARVAELTGAIAVTWTRLERVVRQLGHSPKVEAALAHIRSTFMTEGQATYAAMADAARQGAPPPMDFLTWRAWTVAMLTNTLGARDAPIAQALDEVQDLRSEARARLSVAAGAAGGAALIAFGAALFLQRRVVAPIADLTFAIDRVTEHDEAAEDALATADRREARNDEIGALSRALHRFRERSREIRQLNQRFDAALANLPQGLCVFDNEHRLVVCNSRYTEIYRFRPADTVPGTPLRQLLDLRYAYDRFDGTREEFVEHWHRRVNLRESSEAVIELRDGRSVALRVQPMPGGGWISTHEDITDRRKAEAQIAYMAHHDALTGLPNRLLFHQEMSHAVVRAGRGEPIAILCLDLDQFKTVNDTLGHPVGDALLILVAERVRGCVGEHDTVARLGGDEFAIIQVGPAQPDGAIALARHVIDALSAPYEVEGHSLVVGTSVGIAIAPATGADPDHLLKCADLALYRAKEDGRGTYRFFEPELDQKVQQRRALEADLRSALANDRFELHYQPIVSLDTGQVTTCEALLRWNHPTRGYVSPAEFISVAEETGLIVPIGAWVMRQACHDAVRWPRDLKVAINLSPVQLRNRQLPLEFANALSSSGLLPSRLEIEVTETVMLAEADAMTNVLHQLRQLGVRISMDDFGTGYSSLSHLRRFPFDKIKIDRSFVIDVSRRHEAAAIVRAVAQLGSSLAMITTAEGVETVEQLQALREAGCTEAQGFLFSPAVPAPQVPEIVKTIHAAKLAA
jgi:diguanylate cyclase (GGDEF)-like protein